ncbi:ribosomal protein L1 [Neolentinus lepideus HHB14362 ss-1]|uniref:Ribosomal L1 domain-containing protein 1 n=1 Tax=Neolentinus lepideus HHB14362 ss-1 TaxID=1314782 RepID=A0A165UWG6_9AGAM|nr:ribosomal protein L1 [Neolentinus lepideus HHB14362 ss-1]
MSEADLIDSHVSSKQCKKAVDALLEHALQIQKKKEETELLPDKEQHVWLVVAVKKMQPEKKLMPFKIPIKHPLVDPRTTPVCLITKDPQREYKDLLESHGIKFVSRIVGISKLKGKFKPFEARRMLLQENGLFLADERVVPLLPGLLGKRFFEAKKQPIPVCMTRKDLKGALERAISSTYMHQNQGTCTSIKVGTLSQKPSQILDNLKSALPAIIKRIKGEWDNIQSLNIKTSTSVSLPIWSCDLGAEEGARWDGLVAGEESDEVEMEVDEIVPSPKGKGKKRAAEPEPVEELQPKKKAKAGGAAKPAKPAVVEGKAFTAEDMKKAEKAAQPEPPKSSGEPYLALTTPPAAKKQRNKQSKEKSAESSTVPGAEEPPTTAVQTTPAPAGEKKKKRKSKQLEGTADAPLVPVSISEVLVSDSTTIAPTSGAEADVESIAEVVTKRQKRKKARAAFIGSNPDEASATQQAPVAQNPEVVAPKAKKPRKLKRKSRSAGDDNTESASGPSATSESAMLGGTLATPIAEKKKARVLAADFFDPEIQATPTTTNVPAAPVNTPATPGNLDPSAKRKRRTKASAPVDVPKLMEALSEAKTLDPVSKVVSASKASESDVTGDTQTADPTPAKKKRRNKSKKADSDTLVPGPEGGSEAAEPETVSVTQGEMKQKRKERKKDKVTKGKPGKSAKEEIIGKKASLA